jgi:probable rRNA maturation factor
MIIQYQNNQRKFKAAKLKKIVEDAIRNTLMQEKINEFLTKNSIEPVFSITLTNNRNIREINKSYRNIDKPTDVLSFPMLEITSARILTRIPKSQIFITTNNKKEANFGDIVISLEKAYEQSQEYGHSFEREVAFLTVHSVLHLIGYDHIDAEDEKKMIKKQKQIMSDISI